MRRYHRRRKQYGSSQQQPTRKEINTGGQRAHAARASICAPSGGLSPEQRAAFFRVVTADDRLFLSRYIASLGFTGADRADLVQEVLTGALEAFPRFDPNQGGVRPWLAGIAERQASNLRRRAYRRRDVELTEAILDGLTDPAPLAEQLAMEESRRRVLWELLERIPKQRLEVFVAFELGCLSYEQIAEEQGISPKLAETRHRLARRDIDRFRKQWQAKQRFRGHPTVPIVLAWLANSGAANAVGQGAGRVLGRILLGVIVAVVAILASAATLRADVVPDAGAEARAALAGALGEARREPGPTVVTGAGPAASKITSRRSVRGWGDPEK